MSKRGTRYLVLISVLLTVGIQMMTIAPSIKDWVHKIIALTSTTEIRAINSGRETFLHRKVGIHGKVNKVWKVPGIRNKYWIDDDSAEIEVRTERDLPLVGDRVVVVGKVDADLALGSLILGLYLEELERP